MRRSTSSSALRSDRKFSTRRATQAGTSSGFRQASAPPASQLSNARSTAEAASCDGPRLSIAHAPSARLTTLTVSGESDTAKTTDVSPVRAAATTSCFAQDAPQCDRM